MAGLIDQSDLLIVSEIADLAIKLGPEVYDAITKAIGDTRPELVAGSLPGSSADKLDAEAKHAINEKFHQPQPFNPTEP